MTVKNLAQLTMTEYNSAAHKSVRAMTSNLLKSLEEIGSEGSGTKLAHKLVVIDWKKFSGLINSTRDIEWSDNLSGGLWSGRLIGETQIVECWGLTCLIRHGGQLSSTIKEILAFCLFPNRYSGFVTLLSGGFFDSILSEKFCPSQKIGR